jgi:hypothetical protein
MIFDLRAGNGVMGATVPGLLCGRERYASNRVRSAPMADDSTGKLRDRAYEIADTGRFDDWDAVAAELEREKMPSVLVRRLGHDALFKIMITNRIKADKERR